MKKGILGFAVAMMVFGLSTISSLAATGTVTAGTAKIREKASTDSSVVASTSKGAKIDIVGAEKDSSGTVWYKVPVSGGSYGYVRSDLVETSDKIDVTDNSSTSSTSTSTSKPEATVPTAIGEQAATVKCSSNVKVRAGASTQHDVVTSLPNGTAITLIGEANDAAGNKWYQLRCEYNGKTIEGYIRSDLIAIGSNSSAANGTDSTDAALADGSEAVDGAEVTDGAEAENPDASQEGDGSEEAPAEEPEHNDYEVVYMTDTENPDTGKYYLYNNIDGTMADVEVLFSSVTTANENVARLESESSQKNIVIIILAVVIVLLFIGLTILIIKLRGAYEYDYDDEDDEEEEEEPAPRRRRRDYQEDEVEERPRRQERAGKATREEEMRPARRERGREEVPEREGRPSRNGNPERQGQPVRRPAENNEGTVKKAPRKAQNFLTDDDEFEFEFLNMDDKDI